MNPELTKRLIVDSENFSEIRRIFFENGSLSDLDTKKLLSESPKHNHISWGPNSLTLISWEGIESLHKCILDTLNIEGDFIETGVWRGGMCILAKSIYDSLNSKKRVFVADSFEGLPKPDPKYPKDKNDTHYLSEYLKVSLPEVQKNFEQFNCLDEKVIFLKGWFKDTLHDERIEKISILRLDGDMYESTWDSLTALYHKLQPGGYCIIDDYFHYGCREAIHDFRIQNNINEEIIKVSPNVNDEIHYWKKI